MRSSREKILRYFPTERHKRFYFPIRPLMTATIGTLLLVLVALGALPAFWGIVLMAVFAFDDLPLSPLIKLTRAINNLVQGRKKNKSIVIIAAVVLGLIAGGLIAAFVLTGFAPFMLAISSFIIGTGCSPTYLMIGAILGFVATQFNNKVTPYLGIAIGLVSGFIVSFFFPPLAIPIFLDALVISALACAFATTVIAKQCMRLYYKVQYGDTNADGYEMARAPEAQDKFLEQQANTFGVTKKAFTKLTDYCKTRIQSLKEHASMYDKFSLKRHYKTNAYKDIYHSLMSPNLSREDVITTKKLLGHTKESSSWPNNRQKNPAMFTGRRGYDFHRRLFFHQHNIHDGGGIDEALIIPFLDSQDDNDINPTPK